MQIRQGLKLFCARNVLSKSSKLLNTLAHSSAKMGSLTELIGENWPFYAAIGGTIFIAGSATLAAIVGDRERRRQAMLILDDYVDQLHDPSRPATPVTICDFYRYLCENDAFLTSKQTNQYWDELRPALEKQIEKEVRKGITEQQFFGPELTMGHVFSLTYANTVEQFPLKERWANQRMSLSISPNQTVSPERKDYAKATQS